MWHANTLRVKIFCITLFHYLLAPNRTHEVVIISLSLKATRMFEINARYNYCKYDSMYVKLNDGDILVMLGKMQQYYLHSILKDDKCNEARINLTWRWITQHTLGSLCLRSNSI